MTKSSHAEIYAGIMSGTSLDGIDTALVDLSGKQPKLLATHYQIYTQELKNSLLGLHLPAHNELHLAQLISNELAREYAAAALILLNKAGVGADQIQAIGCHGQTIRHCPDQGYSLQLCNAALLAELSDITVASDFRSRDIAAGGQGAPLVPAFHDQVMRHPNIHRVIVNIGGISNLTNLPPGQVATGFDCGPGNLLMDAWIAKHTQQSFDRDGAWAASGQVIPALLQILLDEPFLHNHPPKSSGRDLFNLLWLGGKMRGDEAPVDVQATLLEFTRSALVNSIQRFCPGAQEVYLCGGGAHNKALLQGLETSLPDSRIQLTDTLGLDADYVEAIAFSWLAQQAINGHRLDLTAVTGARHSCILGAIHPK